ncbi:MAG: type II toxin-antitoxin system RelE/ParE family toxin [Candidatus Bathyarchaeota archaeon]|nr:type II toxin-antitoxin system RelE/ParE family toxin [Candidatus Bathyarchaeum sp.]
MLPNFTTEYYKTRIGDYQTIYEIGRNKKQVIILYIGHRKNAYDDLTKFL